MRRFGMLELCMVARVKPAHDEYDKFLLTNLENPVTIPRPNYQPPFNITRASHAVLNVKDLAKSRAFYVDLIGFIVSDEDKDTIYLRGVAEACHHSLVLQRAAVPQCERVGMRCFTEEDLEKAKFHFDQAGLPAQLSFFLIELHLMPPCCGHDRRLHPSRPPADHHYAKRFHSDISSSFCLIAFANLAAVAPSMIR
jgi:catechol 2,3-dioxygenase-like lactoylglutathione lyase family enzyme